MRWPGRTPASGSAEPVERCPRWVFGAPYLQQQEDTMVVDLTQADAMSLATKMVDQFNRRDFDAMIAMGAGKIDYPALALGRHITDPDTFRAAMQAWVDGFSDIRGTVPSATCDGKLLV